MAMKKATKKGKKMVRVTKEVWLADVAENAGVSKAEADKVIKAFVEVIEQRVAEKEVVPVPKFGVFLSRHRNATKTTSINNGKTVKIKAHELPAFKPSDVFKALVNKK